MPYALILPLFGALLVAGGASVLLCALLPPLRRAVPYAWRMLVGSSVGFCVANVFSILFGVVPVLIAAALGVDRDSPSAQLVAGCALLGLFVGPLVASPIGFLGGAWIGLRRAVEAGQARHG